MQTSPTCPQRRVCVQSPEITRALLLSTPPGPVTSTGTMMTATFPASCMLQFQMHSSGISTDVIFAWHVHAQGDTHVQWKRSTQKAAGILHC